MKILIGFVSALVIVMLVSTSLLYAKAEESSEITDFENDNEEVVIDNSGVNPEIYASVARFVGNSLAGGALYDGAKWVAQNTKNKGTPDYSQMQQTGYACYGLKSEEEVDFDKTPEFAR